MTSVDKNQIRQRSKLTGKIKDNLNQLQVAVLTIPYDMVALRLLEASTDLTIALLRAHTPEKE